MDAPRPLAAGFAAPSEADWLRLVEKASGGRSAVELAQHIEDGITLAPLYGPGEAAVFAPRAETGPDGAAWDIRTVIAHPDPPEANARLLEDLQGGATSALVAAASAEGLARTLAGVDLHLATIALDAGFAGPEAAGWLDEVARAAPRARLAFHLDPLTAFAQAGRSPGPLAAHLAAAAQTAARLHPVYPDATLFLATGRAAYEAGGSDAQELALAAACALAYAKAMSEAGLTVAEAFAATVIGVSLGREPLAGVAKVRAARMVAGRLAQACSASPVVAIEARSSRRMLSALDPWTNLLRLTASGFAGAVGGADAVLLDAFTAPLGAPGALARRLARNTQAILMDEAHLACVADPASGAGRLDDHARQLAQAAWALFQAIESRGGAVAALSSGWLAEGVAAVRARRQAAYAAGERAIIGVNLHPDPAPASVEAEAVSRPAPPATALPGPDDTCPPLTPIRWSEPLEAAP